MRVSARPRPYNPGWHLCRDVRNMLDRLRGRDARRPAAPESRGAHSRLDCPAYDDYWGEHNIVVRRMPTAWSRAGPVVKPRSSPR